MRKQRIIAQDRMAALEIIVQTDEAQHAAGAGDKQPVPVEHGRHPGERGGGYSGGQNKIARR
jgi:hypothetical protein